MPDTTRPMHPDGVPPDALFNGLLNAVHHAAQFGGFRGIPFERILPPREQWWKGSTIQRIEAPIGMTGARDPLNFWLGRSRDGRIAAHALIGGQTGSGKSTLFHVLINSLLLIYPPQELQLYLLDYKEGVEFKPYADARPPHIREITPKLDRPAGLRILQELQTELERRGELFKTANVQDLSDYRVRTKETLPRLLLIIDEFQKLFEEQDEIAVKSGQILEDLARRARAFGIHVIMASQSIHISHVSPTIYSQFVTRIALQAPEADIAALFGSENTDAASILDRPGEVIYNDGGGLRERNTPGQVALLREAAIPRVLALVNSLAQEQHA
jgi:DNA segregation ATPase FtsK/SpoIIIE, S-DNA-T family